MPILVAGHYCHDTLIGNASTHRTLGGSSAYVSAILDALGESHEVVAKVGADFLYSAEVRRAPIVAPGRTTAFVDDYRGGQRRGRVEAIAPAIEPGDLRGRWEVGIACAIAGELPPRTLARMREVCRILVADAQAILREIAPEGEVRLRPPEPEALAVLDVLKTSREEAQLLDRAALPGRLTLVVTDGERGASVFHAGGRVDVPASPAQEKDPTGAGDCFLAGFAAALARGMPLAAAGRLGAWCGARAVEHVGVPRLSPHEARAGLLWAESGS